MEIWTAENQIFPFSFLSNKLKFEEQNNQDFTNQIQRKINPLKLFTVLSFIRNPIPP